jgi:hypothetical protein
MARIGQQMPLQSSWRRCFWALARHAPSKTQKPIAAPVGPSFGFIFRAQRGGNNLSVLLKARMTFGQDQN